MQRRIYTHTGRRQINGRWHFLHGAGAIAASGYVSGIEVDLGQGLINYQLPDPRSDDTNEAIRASIELLGIAPDHIIWPLLAAVFRSVLAEWLPAELSVFVVGPTGTFKTCLAAVCTAYFGKGWTGSNTPASWSSTANALERMAFTTKDHVLFIDDLHMAAQLTPKVRQIMETIAENLVHEGDLFGIIATGTSNLSIDLTYDRNMLFAAAEKIVGSGFNPRDMIQMQQRRTLSEIRWRAHVAYKTAFETLKNLARINNRRKVFIYISAGYDFNPFGEQYGMDVAQRHINSYEDQPFVDVERQGAVFSDAELHSEIAELARAANRSNTTFHTLDPRGLMAGADIEYNLPTQEWNSHVFRTQSSLRSLAELTGGIAIVNRNNFVAGLREIDAETSDYYIVGFNTNRPEAGEARTRQLRIDVRRQGAQVRARESYTFEGVAAAAR